MLATAAKAWFGPWYPTFVVHHGRTQDGAVHSQTQATHAPQTRCLNPSFDRFGQETNCSTNDVITLVTS
eukprot:m.121817 g.121817  ORF g.121817 m.121817 type:complete len:69 (-) comp28880_c0_seq1:335-541(-)